MPPISRDHDLAAAGDGRNGERHRFLVTRKIDDAVEAALGFFQDAPDHFGLGRIVGDGGAVLQRALARGGAEIGDRDVLLEHGLRERKPHHADAAEADQQQVRCRGRSASRFSAP